MKRVKIDFSGPGGDCELEFRRTPFPGTVEPADVDISSWWPSPTRVPPVDFENVCMKCQELAARIEQLQPDADARDVARLCLLLSNAVDDLEQLADERALAEAWKQMGLRMQLATDQHAAMTEDLERLTQTNPQKFCPDQVWVLIRAIKVQSQILQLYVGEFALDV